MTNTGNPRLGVFVETLVGGERVRAYAPAFAADLLPYENNEAPSVCLAETRANRSSFRQLDV